ncbi:MAG: hypothetical protein U5L74_11305 [Ideonella sp.]|nr:hypothetical protein [Ideonella sp.]
MNTFNLLGIGLSMAMSSALVTQAQAAPTYDYKALVIVEGVGLVEGPTKAKYVVLGMTKQHLSTSVPGVFCPQMQDFCWVFPSTETGTAIATFNAKQRVSQLTFYQDSSAHKWPTRKGAVDGMTLAAIHALYKGSTLTTEGDPNVYPTEGSVRTRNGNYTHSTFNFCEDTGCFYQTNSSVQKGVKPPAP